MDNEMIERCRQALWDKICPSIRRTPEDDKFYIEVVVEVIKTMREPTKNIVKSMNFVHDKDAIVVWQNAIDAIINEE